MKNTENTPNVYCRFTEMRDISELKENPLNPNRHPKYQLERLAEVIKGNGWRQPITVSDRSGLIVKGHGRYQAARLAGFQQVPVEVQHYESAELEMADLLADNKIAELAEMDEDALAAAVKSVALGDESVLSLTGFSEDELDAILSGDEEGDDTDDYGDDKYTSKIERPHYEITGETPPLSALVNTAKTDELVAEINAAEGISDDERVFLLMAAQRHLQFSYRDVAEYYASANAKMQELMEKSALVIIDYDDAIKYGYAQLQASIQEQKDEEEVPEDL